jgi:hypothetical protein
VYFEFGYGNFRDCKHISCEHSHYENLKLYITNYYKGMFDSSEEGNFNMDETQTSDIPQRMKLRKLFSKWNSTNPQVRMASQLSFTKTFGKLSNQTCSSCSTFYTRDNLSCFA